MSHKALNSEALHVSGLPNSQDLQRLNALRKAQSFIASKVKSS